MVCVYGSVVVGLLVVFGFEIVFGLFEVEFWYLVD